MRKIMKYAGHCYDSCGWIDCEYQETIKHRRKGYEGIDSKCGLFPTADKMPSKSLTCCDRIYGKSYEGEA